VKVPLKLPCSVCGVAEPVDIRLSDSSPDWTCVKGHRNTGLFALEFTIGYKILAKSQYEFWTRRDYSMAIVLAAMAFECEMSRLFIKWTAIDANLADAIVPTDEQIEATLRSYRGIAQKLTATCERMTPLGIEAFALRDVEIRDAIQNRFPSLTIGELPQGFEQTIFWPRNRILHFGFTDFLEADAAKTYSVASLGLDLLRRMDKAKYSATFSRGEKL
jgi:hypothetical protein